MTVGRLQPFGNCPQCDDCHEDGGPTINKAIIITRHVGRRHPTTNQSNIKMLELMMMVIIVPIIIIIIIIIIIGMSIPNTQSRPKNAGHTIPQGRREEPPQPDPPPDHTTPHHTTPQGGGKQPTTTPHHRGGGVWGGTIGPWYGGGRVCGNGRGPLELPLDGGVVLGGRPGLTRKPFASRIPYNVLAARAPVLINLNLYFKPYTQP